MTGPDDSQRRRDGDDDPTGVQHLLSSLPEPGPMPEDLVRRISESLREESERRGHETAAPYALFAGRAPRRRRAPWMAVAATAASLVVLGGGLLTGFGGAMPSQLGMLGFPTRGGGQAEASGTAETSHASPDALPGEGGTAVGGQRTGASLQGGDRGDGVTRGAQVIAMTGRVYDSPSLRAQATALLTSPPAPLRTLAAESPAVGPIGTPLGLASCLRGLGLPGDAQSVVDLATYDDKPVAVIVTHVGGLAQVHVVRRSCTESDPSLLAGPYQL